jgi:hypothetical protein
VHNEVDVKDNEAKLAALYDSNSRYYRAEHEAVSINESIYEPLERLIEFWSTVDRDHETIGSVTRRYAKVLSQLVTGIDRHLRSKEECFGEVITLAPYRFKFANTKRSIYLTYTPTVSTQSVFTSCDEIWTEVDVCDRNVSLCATEYVQRQLARMRERIVADKRRIRYMVVALADSHVDEDVIETLEVFERYDMLNDLYRSLPITHLDLLPIPLSAKSFGQEYLKDYLVDRGYDSDAISAYEES